MATFISLKRYCINNKIEAKDSFHFNDI